MKSVKQLIDEFGGDTQIARIRAFHERWPNISVNMLIQWYGEYKNIDEYRLHALNKYASREDMLKDQESF